MKEDRAEKGEDKVPPLLRFYTRKVFLRIRRPGETKQKTDPDPQHRHE